jgi:pyruvate/2-oxoglutarate dehydrogenase complex dihydrolipoamide acyltransferase (E2) component
MITRIRIPQAFENMEEATIGKWLCSEGDPLQNGDALCELITEKTTFDLPVEHLPAPGVLRQIIAPEKSIVPVGFIIALVGNEDDELPGVAAENAALLEKNQAAQTISPVIAPPPATRAGSTPGAGTRLRATPAARRAAKEHGVSLEELSQKLSGKVLTEEDVLAAL